MEGECILSMARYIDCRIHIRTSLAWGQGVGHVGARMPRVADKRRVISRNSLNASRRGARSPATHRIMAAPEVPPPPDIPTKSRFTYRHLGQLAKLAVDCPLRVIAHV